MLHSLLKEIMTLTVNVKDNNIEQALRILKRKLQRDGFFKVIKLKNTYEKPSEKKKRIKQENTKRAKIPTDFRMCFPKMCSRSRGLNWCDCDVTR